MTILGRLVRLPLRLVPRRLVVPILSGPARGYRWRVGAGVHGYWIGVYESRFAATFAGAIAPGAIVWDVGAHAGYYTLVAIARGARRVHAFEPWPPNLAFLEQHIRANALGDRVTVHTEAVGAARGRSFFEAGDLSQKGHLAASGMPIDVVALDDVGVEAPSVVKIDVEGAEVEVLRGMTRTLAAASPTLFVALHGNQLAKDCEALLRAAGYEWSYVEADTIRAGKTGIGDWGLVKNRGSGFGSHGRDRK